MPGKLRSLSTYFVLLTDFKYKRMNDDPEHSTNILYTWNCMLGVAVYFWPGAKSGFWKVSYAINAKNGDVNTWVVCNKTLLITYSNNSAQLVLVMELWVKIWVVVYLWPGLYYRKVEQCRPPNSHVWAWSFFSDCAFCKASNSNPSEIWV